MMMMMIHNDIKVYGGMVCHKTRNIIEKTHRTDNNYTDYVDGGGDDDDYDDDDEVDNGNTKARKD